MRTDFIAILVAVLMLFALHCDGAVETWDNANHEMHVPSTFEIANITNEISYCFWIKTRSIANAGYCFSKSAQFDLGSGNGPIDFHAHGDIAASSLWRTTASNMTNTPPWKWNFYAVTHRFLDSNSMRFYLNGTNFSGTWIQTPTNRVAVSNNSELLIGARTGTFPRWLGTYTEVSIWTNILTQQQIELMYKSGVKGISTQINPQALVFYSAMDSGPNEVRVLSNLKFPDRSKVRRDSYAYFPAQGTTFPTGKAESIHSYQPND